MHLTEWQPVLAETITAPRRESDMSILFVLLTFLIVIAANYFYFHVPHGVPLEAEVAARPNAPVMTKEAGFALPEGYSFHPGHTWVIQENVDNARIGMDKFAAELVGPIDRIEVAELNRWVRQGQRLATLHSGSTSFDVMSPVEGVVMDINKEVVRKPVLANQDPYNEGWIAVLKSPDLPTNQKNLLRGPMVAPWMHYNVSRLNAALASLNPPLAQDGGMPLSDVLPRMAPELRIKLAKEFLLN